jgi:predicted AlkP superfamily pyrophosphatase or phosphodiesterase
MRKRITSVIITALLLKIGIYAQNERQIPPEKPKIIIGIVVDQMRYDYIYRYWDKLGDDGFKKLIDEGTFCKNAQFNYLFAQSAVGYATISTGAMPASHGVVSDHWYERLRGSKVYATEDEKVNAIGGSYEMGQHSPRNLLASTVADEIKINQNLKAKVFGVGLKDHAPILSTGHTADAAYWFDPVTGSWMTSSYYMDSLPAWVEEFNEKEIPDLYLEKQWNTLLSIDEYTESLADTTRFENGFGDRYSFPYDLEELSRINRREKDYRVLASTPFGNTYTKDFAISLIVNEGLGKDGIVDFLAINFSSTEEIGLKFGPNSVEIEDTYLRLDQDLAHLLTFIEEEIGKKNVLIYLTSNHGVSLNPGYLEELRVPGGFFNLKGAITLLNSYLRVAYGGGEWIESFSDQQIFLNRQLIEDSQISLEDIQDRVSRFMVQYSGIANTITSTTLDKTSFTDGPFSKFQNGYNQKRSGDVLINYEPGWVIRNGNATGHNTSYRYDSHVPLIWYGWKIKRQTISSPIDMTSIAPTIAFLLNISYPSGCSGQAIEQIIE